MEKKKSKNFIIEMGIFPYDIMFSVGQTDKDFKDSCRKRLSKNDYKTLLKDCICSLTQRQYGRTLMIFGGGQTVVRLNMDIKHPCFHSTVAHEIFHAVEFILRTVSIGLSEHNDEVYAYAIGYVTKEFYNNIK